MDILLVIDMQAAAVERGDQYRLGAVLDRIRALGNRVRANGGKVVFVQHDGLPGSGFEPGSPGWEVAADLQPEPADLRVRKFVNDAFHATSLDAILAELHPDRVIVCGWATDMCVDATVRGAVARGYDVVAVADGHTLADRPHMRAAAVIEHHNWVWTELIAPGSIAVTKAAEIPFVGHGN